MAPHEVITPSTEVILEGEGMPLAQTGEVVIDTQEQLNPVADMPKGNMIIRFNVKFPRKILPHNIQTILDALKTCVD